MAESPSHQFGQIIGDILEEGILPLLQEFAAQHGLYLDKRGPRPGVRKGVKCSWQDAQGNKHDLDYVLERGGSTSKRGLPVAFIETAWRRYTKHSKNKAQEIQGAVVPLVDTYRKVAPFAGAVLAGEFTANALTQLRSVGFSVVHISYEDTVRVFRSYGVDASSNEGTPDATFARKVSRLQSLTSSQRAELASAFVAAGGEHLQSFIAGIKLAVTRTVDRVIVVPLHGAVCELVSVADAISFIQNYNDDTTQKGILRYEIEIRYNNGNLVKGQFQDKATSISFLKEYVPL